MPDRIEIQHVDPSTLRKNPWNSNVVGPEMQERLDESVRRFGVYKPIVVRELGDGSLEIVGGQHRAESAIRLGTLEVPVVSLGRISDKQAKQIGLADNGRYGEDDALKLGDILKELGHDDVAMFLPFDEADLAGIFAADAIDLEGLMLDEEPEDIEPLPGAERKTISHALMRFMVPLEDQARVQAAVQRVIKEQGLSDEKDSTIAAGMALVHLIRIAQEAM